MPTCPIPWCGQEVSDKVRHPDHEAWAKELEEGRAVFMAVRNPDGSIDVHRWDKAKLEEKRPEKKKR